MTRAGWLTCLAALALVRSAILGTVIPPYQSSDEPGHLDYARVVADGRLPVAGKTQLDPEIVGHNKDAAAHRQLMLYGIDDRPLSREGFQPPLAYLVPAAGYRIAGGPRGGLAWFRLVDAIAGVLAVLLAFRAARLAFPSSPYAGPTAALTVALLPSFAIVAATANNDALTIMVAAVVLALAARLARGGGPLRSFYGLGLLVGIAGLVKASGLLLGVPSGMAALLAPAHASRVRLRRLVVVAGAAAIVAAPWVVRNLALYDDLFGTSPFELVDAQPGSDLGGLPLLLGAAPDVPGAERFWPAIGRGVVGVLRWDDLRLGTWAYLLALAGAAAMVVAITRWWRHRATSADRRAAAVLASGLAAYVAGTIWFAMTVDYQPQGRYLLPALVGVVGVAGAALGRRGFAVAAGLLIALQAAALVTALDTFGAP